jgi:hypothetical protein
MRVRVSDTAFAASQQNGLPAWHAPLRGFHRKVLDDPVESEVVHQTCTRLLVPGCKQLESTGRKGGANRESNQ